MGLINSGVAQVKGPVEYEGGKGSDNEPAGAVSAKPDAIEKEDVEEVEETQRKKECRKKKSTIIVFIIVGPFIARPAAQRRKIMSERVT